MRGKMEERERERERESERASTALYSNHIFAHGENLYKFVQQTYQRA